MIEKHQFPLDRGYFRVHLVLEHHVLRKMGGRVSSEMSEMETARRHDDARELVKRNSHS